MDTATGALAGTGTLFGDELRVGDIIDITGASGTDSRTGIVVTDWFTADDRYVGTELAGTVANISVGKCNNTKKKISISTTIRRHAGTVTTAADSTTVTGTAITFLCTICGWRFDCCWWRRKKNFRYRK